MNMNSGRSLDPNVFKKRIAPFIRTLVKREIELEANRSNEIDFQNRLDLFMNHYGSPSKMPNPYRLPRTGDWTDMVETAELSLGPFSGVLGWKNSRRSIETRKKFQEKKIDQR